MERPARLCLVLCLAFAVGVQAQKPPSTRDQEKLAAEYLAADATTAEGQARQRAILAELQAVPPLGASQLRDWQKKLDKLHQAGRTLAGKGDHWFWDNSRERRKRNEPIVQRGRYLVGGNLQRPKGLLIAMHGGGLGSGDAGPAAAAFEPAAMELGWVMVAPEVLERTEHGWTDSGTEEFVLQLVDAALRTWQIDPDRVYFAGHSMGGYGAWMLGAHHADRVAAIAPSAGAPTPILGRGDIPIDIVEGVIPSLRNVFVSVYQSLDDPQVPPRPNQLAVKLLGEARQKWGGFAHHYWEVDGHGHGAPPGGHVAQLRRVAEVARDPVPQRIVWQPVLAWKRQFHWLWWELPSPQSLVVADLDRARNTVAVTCDKSTQDLWVLLDERMVDLGQEVVVTRNGEETFRGVVQPTLDALLISSGQPDPKLRFVARVPAFARG